METVGNVHPCPPAKLLLAKLEKRYNIRTDLIYLFKTYLKLTMIITINIDRRLSGDVK